MVDGNIYNGNTYRNPPNRWLSKGFLQTFPSTISGKSTAQEWQNQPPIVGPRTIQRERASRLDQLLPGIGIASKAGIPPGAPNCSSRHPLRSREFSLSFDLSTASLEHVVVRAHLSRSPWQAVAGRGRLWHGSVMASPRG